MKCTFQTGSDNLAYSKFQIHVLKLSPISSFTRKLNIDTFNFAPNNLCKLKTVICHFQEMNNQSNCDQKVLKIIDMCVKHREMSTLAVSSISIT